MCFRKILPSFKLDKTGSEILLDSIWVKLYIYIYISIKKSGRRYMDNAYLLVAEYG